jgi:hypothetical protein
VPIAPRCDGSRAGRCSTTANRRFPDFVTQRLVKAALAGAPPPHGDDELAAVATNCTAQEDAANRVERLVAKSAAALRLASHVGERVDAIVTGAGVKGTWVRIFTPPPEGKLVAGSADLEVGRRSSWAPRWSAVSSTSSGRATPVAIDQGVSELVLQAREQAWTVQSGRLHPPAQVELPRAGTACEPGCHEPGPAALTLAGASPSN